MNSSPSPALKALVAALSLAITAAVPLLTVQYAVRAQAQTNAPSAPAPAKCERCAGKQAQECPGGEKDCAKQSCPQGACPRGK